MCHTPPHHTYCIPVWGGAAKTKFIVVERAQRAVLKVMLGRPFRSPTTELYAECKVLTVRQLFVLRATLRKLNEIPLPDPTKRKAKNVCLTVRHKTAFATRQFYVISTIVYKNICKTLQIAGLNYHQAKSTVQSWLQDQDYTRTEELLNVQQ